MPEEREGEGVRNVAQLSKFLSFILRHKPDAIDLVLDPQGRASIDELIEKFLTEFAAGDVGTSNRRH